MDEFGSPLHTHPQLLDSAHPLAGPGEIGIQLVLPLENNSIDVRIKVIPNTESEIISTILNHKLPV